MTADMEAGFVCHKATVLRDTIKGAHCITLCDHLHYFDMIVGLGIFVF
jgi:hypothetical protein